MHPGLDLEGVEDAELRLHPLPAEDGHDEAVELAARVEVDARLLARDERHRPHEVEGGDHVLEALRDRPGTPDLLRVPPDGEVAGEIEFLDLVGDVASLPRVLLEPHGGEVPGVDPRFVMCVDRVEP